MPSRPIICEPGQAKPRKGRIEWCWSNPSTDLKAGTVPRLHAGSHPRPPPQLYHQKMCLCSKSRPLIQVPCFQSIYWLPWKAESILVPEVRAWWPPPFRFAALQPETPQKRLACYPHPPHSPFKSLPGFQSLQVALQTTHWPLHAHPQIWLFVLVTYIWALKHA